MKKKLSMTAQQYKNSQIKMIKSVVTLSPNIRRRAEKGSCADLKVMRVELGGGEQSKSMNQLVGLPEQAPLFTNGCSLLTIARRE